MAESLSPGTCQPVMAPVMKAELAIAGRAGSTAKSIAVAFYGKKGIAEDEDFRRSERARRACWGLRQRACFLTSEWLETCSCPPPAETWRGIQGTAGTEDNRRHMEDVYEL